MTIPQLPISTEKAERTATEGSAEGNGSSRADSAMQGTDSLASPPPLSAGPLDVEAQLAERFADPEWVAKWHLAGDEQRPFAEMLMALRSEEGASVTLLSDNPDFNGQPNNAIECCGDWTDWQERRFTGETLRAAVLGAYQARRAALSSEALSLSQDGVGAPVRAISSTDTISILETRQRELEEALRAARSVLDRRMSPNVCAIIDALLPNPTHGGGDAE